MTAFFGSAAVRFVRTRLVRLGMRFARGTTYTDERLAGMPCTRCGKTPSSEQWLSGVCADIRTPGRWFPLCTECDIDLNEMMLRFFFGDSRDDDLKLYAAYKRARDRRSLSPSGTGDSLGHRKETSLMYLDQEEARRGIAATCGIPEGAERDAFVAKVLPLADGIGEALNGPFYELQVMISQNDGGVASLFASGWDAATAAGLATKVAKAGWDGEAVVTWIRKDDAEIEIPVDHVSEADIGKVVDGFLASVAEQAGVGRDAFDGNDRAGLVADFRRYLDLESSTALSDGP